MVTVRNHLDEMHAKCAKASGALADSCEKLAYHFSDMAKATASDAAYSKLAGEFSKMAKVHANQQQYHEAACQTIKSEQDALDKAIKPDSISSIARIDVPSEAFGIRAITRPGQPTPGAAVDKANVPVQFRHLISMDEV